MNDLPRPAAFGGLGRSRSRRAVQLALRRLRRAARSRLDRSRIVADRPLAWLDGVASLPVLLQTGSRACAARSTIEADDALVVARIGSALRLLFEGIGGPKTVSPYKSVHRDGGRLFGAPAGEMEAILAAHDLSVAVSAHEAPDHIAVELAAAALLLAEGEPDAEAMIERLSGLGSRVCG